MQRYIRNEEGDGKRERREPGKVWKNINQKVKLEVMLAQEELALGLQLLSCSLACRDPLPTLGEEQL